MNIGIAGLGLIGGSMAKAIKQHTEHKVFGEDINEQVLCKAKLIEAIDGDLTEENLGQCDLLILALYPEVMAPYLQGVAKYLKKGTVVVDCCGVKRSICEEIRPIREEYGFVYVGGHPMAGLEVEGFEHSKQTLFSRASMILTPFDDVDFEAMEMLRHLFLSIGFSVIQIATVEKHDKVIAYTSQLAHVVSSAYVLSPTSLEHKGFSAGSFQDMTRVAKLNEGLWTELFMRNRDNLVEELDSLIHRLEEYSKALKEEDRNAMMSLLKAGRERRLQVL